MRLGITILTVCALAFAAEAHGSSSAFKHGAVVARHVEASLNRQWPTSGKGHASWRVGRILCGYDGYEVACTGRVSVFARKRRTVKLEETLTRMSAQRAVAYVTLADGELGITRFIVRPARYHLASF